MKLPKIAKQEKDIITINKVASFPTYQKYLWCLDEQGICNLSDSDLFTSFIYYLSFQNLAKASKIDNLKGYQYSNHKHMVADMSAGEKYNIFISEIRNRFDGLFDNLAIFIEMV